MADANYEYAGIMLTYKGTIILGIRIKDDNGKDNEEMEILGGKPEPEDGRDGSVTAHAGLIEDVGSNILAANWRPRAMLFTTRQPFSQRWTWCYILELTDEEFARLIVCNENLSHWPADERRVFVAETGRHAPVRKATTNLVQVTIADFIAYISQFCAFDATNENRMASGKAFGEQYKVRNTILPGGNAKEWHRAIRAFNLVIFETNFSIMQMFLEALPEKHETK